MNFPEKLKAYRDAAGLSQDELAELTGITQASINHYEKGNRVPSWNVIQALSAALGKSCLDFTDDSTALKRKKK